MIDKIRILASIVNNPVTRKGLQKISEFCEKCGKNRIENAIELALGYKEKACIYCSAAAKIIEPVLKKGAESFNVPFEKMRERFSDPYWRKGLASVIKGLAHFGVRKPFVPGAPFQVVWDITYACNLRCKHCYSSAGKIASEELNTEEALKAVEKLDRLGVTIIAFSGGEPLIRKDFFKIARYAADKGIYIAVATNGTLISDEVARKMKESGVGYLQISLDGLKETHDSFRGVPGTFDRTLNGIRNAVKYGFFVNVSMTVTKLNYHEVQAVVELCEKLGVDWFMHYNYIPTGRGGAELDISAEEREKLLEYLCLKNLNSKMSLLSTAPQFARVALKNESSFIPTHFYNLSTSVKELAEFIGGCGAGRFYFAIKANGDIQPCVFFPLKVGNVKFDDLEELWLKNKVFEELRGKDLIEGCGSCVYRYICGGCRARAFNYFGSYLKPDPGCLRSVQFAATK
ncbi:MAG: radical SAM protein [Archaeoglobaceae archaeon]|nr:radical SAM protein [Archaeoglobaceae archaeon]MCX8151827.1 radical SAM protein [Archaeoglobaceae archaeon]MDW8014341.1 radical SAM protein [Archaeoglobaceae archaeon]